MKPQAPDWRLQQLMDEREQLAAPQRLVLAQRGVRLATELIGQHRHDPQLKQRFRRWRARFHKMESMLKRHHPEIKKPGTD